MGSSPNEELMKETGVWKVRLLLGAALGMSLAVVLWGPSYGEAARELQEIVGSGTDRKVPWEVDADRGLQLAARFNAVMLLVLLMTARWWWRPLSEVQNADRRGLFSGLPRWTLVVMLALVGLGVGLRLPLAARSLWWDELWTIRQCSHGTWKQDSEPQESGAEGWKFSPTTWKRCAFYYQKPTNHVPMSLLQKASLTAHDAVTSGREAGTFSDLTARVPALILSALSLLLLGGVAWQWTRSAGAVLGAVAVLAAHPMAIRYGVDARGYALVMPLVLSGCLAGTLLVRSGGRDGRLWLWLGLNQCLWLWAFPHGVVDVLLMTLVLGWLLWRSQRSGADRLAVVLRLVFSHGLAGLVFLQLFLPNLLQATRWVGGENQGHQLDARILKNTLAQIGTGLRWVEPAATAEGGAGLVSLSGRWGMPAAGALVLAGVGLLVVGGLWKVWRRGQPSAALMAALGLSGGLFAAISYGIGLYYYPRFAIAQVPLVALGMGMAWVWPMRWRWVAAGVMAAWLATALPGTVLLLKRPIEPLRAVANWLEVYGQGGVALGYGHGREALVVLKRDVIGVDDAAQIRAAVAKAKAAGQEAFLAVGHFQFNRSVLPDGFGLIDDPSQFEEVARFDGVESEFHYRIFKAR